MTSKQIRFIKQAVFKDREGSILEVYDVGQVIPYTAIVNNYYVTARGGIYFDEAVPVEETTND